MLLLLLVGFVCCGWLFDGWLCVLLCVCGWCVVWFTPVGVVVCVLIVFVFVPVNLLAGVVCGASVRVCVDCAFVFALAVGAGVCASGSFSSAMYTVLCGV